MNWASFFTLAAAIGLGAMIAPPSAWAAEPAARPSLPGDSLYHLDAPLVDQDGTAFGFADGLGRPRVVTLFYSSCKFVCPLIIDTLLKVERALPEAQRGDLDVLMISLDPDKDTPEALKRVADKRKLDTPRWRLARTDKAHVRRVAALLGIQYKQLEDGEFSHASVLVLLDPQGRIVARSDRLGEADAEFVAAVRRVLDASPR
jgi:protein SCO1/2